MSYSKRHYRLVSPPENTPKQIAARVSYSAALAQARDETRAKFPILTTANFVDALKFQEKRIAELTATEPP